jgi:hypothetical protein
MTAEAGGPHLLWSGTEYVNSWAECLGRCRRGTDRLRTGQREELHRLPEVWVAQLFISEAVAQKINQRHRIEPHEVRSEVVCVAGLRGRWDDHPERGRRAVIDISIRGRLAAVVLYPREHQMGDAWNLGSIYFVD